MKNTELEARMALFAQTYSADLLVAQPTFGPDDLTIQNQAYAGTGGTSEGNQAHRFAPAYKDVDSGKAVASCFADGRPAPIHLLAGLPEGWIINHADRSEMPTLRPNILVGFIRDGKFFTRAEAAKACAH